MICQEPLFVTTEKDIFFDTIVNPEMITSTRNSFLIAIELNVGRMSKYISQLQRKLYASEQRYAKAE